MTFSEREKRLLLITGPRFAWRFDTGMEIRFQPGRDTSVSEPPPNDSRLFAKIKTWNRKKTPICCCGKIGNETAIYGEEEILKLIAEIEQVAGKSGVQMKNWDPPSTTHQTLAQLDIK
jgi:hypothetical protein